MLRLHILQAMHGCRYSQQNTCNSFFMRIFLLFILFATAFRSLDFLFLLFNSSRFNLLVHISMLYVCVCFFSVFVSFSFYVMDIFLSRNGFFIFIFSIFLHLIVLSNESKLFIFFFSFSVYLCMYVYVCSMCNA